MSKKDNIFAHIVSPNEYNAKSLSLHIEDKYNIIDIYNIPRFAQKQIIKEAIKAIHDGDTGRSQLPIIILGPAWNIPIIAKYKYIEKSSEGDFIYSRICNDTRQFSINWDQVKCLANSDRVVFDMSKKHLSGVYQTIHRLYKDYTQIDMATLRQELLQGQQGLRPSDPPQL